MHKQEKVATDAIKHARESLKMTQAEFAETLGISRNYLAQMEIGRCRVPDKIMQKIEKMVITDPEDSVEHWKIRALQAEEKLTKIKRALAALLD